MPTKEDVKEQADEATEATEASTNGGAAKGGARPMPIYAPEKVTELPVDVTMPRSGPRTPPQLVEALQVAKNDPGELYCVATFQSANGAKASLKRIEKKELTIPAGNWDFEVRRVEAPNSTAEKPARWSKLYAKFLG